jgi:hypothetical protein
LYAFANKIDTGIKISTYSNAVPNAGKCMVNIGLSFDGSHHRFYINGTEIGTMACGRMEYFQCAAAEKFRNLFLGVSNTNSNSFNGITTFFTASEFNELAAWRGGTELKHFNKNK